MKLKLVSTVAALAILAPAAAMAETIKIGLLAPQEGVFTEPGNDGIRGFQLALNKYNGEINGNKIEWVLGPTDATPDRAVREARRLIEQEGVDFILGPLSGSEGLALRDYAKTIPDKTIINTASGALETTYVDPAPNFFRFHPDGAQWGYGLGSYVVNEKGWKRVATVAADYSFGYTNFMGFAVDFCKAGGEIVERFWLPLGSGDFASIIAALPDDVDAIYLGVGGTDAVNFLNQYEQAGGDTNIIGGTIMVDQTVLTARGRAKEALVGTPSSGPQADDWDNPEWQAYVKDYQETFPDGFPSPSLFATNYYGATLATLMALEQIGGELDEDQANFHAALSSLEFDAPNGHIKLDENRQAIGSIFITEVVEGADGSLHNTFKAKVDNVDQKLGMSKEEFDAIGLPSRDTPDCAALNP
ncbi:ABC transporter substrate-binding protein [Mesorhizobium microcysteis]|uniref:ABC transporter substrate-binding protein n=1 Tax=Neoaquamicrobium microcysteis TaxID=2682781 RepID=A0A5D4GM19_9HYPH|nr:ABC transporter substrate-binding protein [Mesorhizobium microcysteis]TYR29368.1 ABC transporter substrate-binding protein [Mesorhizobium microcysteis]